MRKFILSVSSLAAVGAAVAVPVPRPALAERLASDVDVIGIVHWGLNTYTDREWGYGDESPAMLAPKAFDADQIVGACAAGGIRGLVVVAKHHDGFCLGPTQTTGHNISQAPVRGGKGDYVKEMSDACRKAGLSFGVYCSPWDRNSADYGTPKYVDTYHAQIKELLDGRYGEVFEMWFDGANGGDGYYGGARTTRKIADGYYDFDTIFGFVRALQPKVCIFTELRDDADFRWPCNEKGMLDPDSRATIRPFDGPNYTTYGNVGDVDGTVFHPCEADFPLRPGWFCHEAQNGDVKGGEYLMRIYLSSVGNGGTMNIGIAPSKDGLLHDGDVQALRRFREVKEAFFAKEVREGPCNFVVMSEDILQGERIVKWSLAVKGQELLAGKSIGRRRMRTLDASVEAGDVKVTAVDAQGQPVPVTVRLYAVEPSLVAAVKAAKDPAETVDQHGLGARVSGDAKTYVCKFEQRMAFDKLRVAPDAEKVGGAPVEFRLFASDDGAAWRPVKGAYRLDNVAANPIPQVVALEEQVETVYLKLEAVRTLKDEPLTLLGLAVAR